MKSGNILGRRHKAVTICFAGIDGSGKTTQADLVSQFLSRKFKRKIKRIRFFSSDRTIVGELPVRSFISTFIENLDKPASTGIGTLLKVTLRIACILVDSWLSYYSNVFKRNENVVIYDRYYYDSLVAVALKHYCMRHFVIIISKLIPKPDIVILLEISSKASVARKHEHTLNEAEEICNLYAKFKQLLPIRVINAELDITQVEEQVKNMFVEINGFQL